MITTSFGHCWLEFKNGYEVSIYNGFGSYSENNFNKEIYNMMMKPKYEDRCPSKNCEVAIIYDGKFCTSKFIETDDDVIGYIKPDELADLIIKVKNAEKI